MGHLEFYRDLRLSAASAHMEVSGSGLSVRSRSSLNVSAFAASLGVGLLHDSPSHSHSHLDAGGVHGDYTGELGMQLTSVGSRSGPLGAHGQPRTRWPAPSNGL